MAVKWQGSLLAPHPPFCQRCRLSIRSMGGFAAGLMEMEGEPAAVVAVNPRGWVKKGPAPEGAVSRNYAENLCREHGAEALGQGAVVVVAMSDGTIEKEQA